MPDSVATRIRCGGTFNDGVITHSLLARRAKKMKIAAFDETVGSVAFLTHRGQ